MISAFIERFPARLGAGAPVLLALMLFGAGCGSSGTDLSSGQMGTAKARTEEERYKYEGTGTAKQKTLIRRRDERFKELIEADKKKG